MNINQLEKGKKLVEIIKVTEEGLKQLKILAEKRYDENIGDMLDGQYNLTICEHSDGSGKRAKLGRLLGNAVLLDTIIETLENQLESFEREFSQL